MNIRYGNRKENFLLITLYVSQFKHQRLGKCRHYRKYIDLINACVSFIADDDQG